MKLETLVNSIDALNKLLTVEMDIKKAYELRKFTLIVNEKLKPYQETRQQLFQKYGEPQGNQIVIKDENLKAFQADLKDLFEVEGEFELEIPKITIDDLSGKIDTNTLIALEYLIKD